MQTEENLNEYYSKKRDSFTDVDNAVLCLGRVSSVEPKPKASDPVPCSDFVKVLSRTTRLEEKNAAIEEKY